MKQNYNNESLARLGHGKWKSALGHTLLIIGMVLMSLGAYAQSGEPSHDIPSGLKMNKQWIPNPDDPTGSTGHVVLETYVTGSTISAVAAVPNDIVLVLDQSGSMDETYSGSTTKLAALKSAVETFCNTVKNDAIANNVNHKIAIVGFASGYSTTSTSWWGGQTTTWTWTNTELLSTQNITAYGNRDSGECQINVNEYRNALVPARQGTTQNLNSRLETAINRIDGDGGTCMQYGLEMAYGVLSNRTETTFTAPDGTTKERGQIVIFFTDGYPGLQFPNNNRFVQGRNGQNTQYVSQTTADAAIEQANILKQHGATIYSLGIFGGVDPKAAYTTVQKEATGYYYWEPQTLPSGQNSGDAAANGLLHMISSNYDGENVALPDSWSSETTKSTNVANRFWYINNPGTPEADTVTGCYFGAGTPQELNKVFSQLAAQSGAEPMEMSAATVVQDEVSSSFTLPSGVNLNDIELYAVKCTGGTLDANNNVITCTFTQQGTGYDEEFGTKTTYASDGTTIQYLTLDNDGVVVEGNNLPENRIDSKGPDGTANTNDDLVQIIENEGENQKISLTGFNFMNMFCGPIIENNVVTGWQGRKLVIKIPLQAADGVWGDGVVTNGPMSFVLPDGSTVAYAFETPVTNVMGSVWTEVVYEKPGDLEEAFDPMNIDSPEKLAWFISMVNGRVGYEKNNKVASNTTLNGRLTADIDMSAHNWVPIGCGYQCNDQGQWLDNQGNVTTDPTKRVKLSYKGTFDGNGHVITGLKNNASKYYKKIHEDVDGVVVFPGMFANIDGGTVHDVFILDSDFRGKWHDQTFVYHGILADTLTSGSIYNCEAAGRMTCNNDDPTNDQKLVYGGLVGLNRGGTIYNCMAMPELTGFAMGGAVGENRSGSFSNGFTNGVYNYIGEAGANAKPVGGIAGTYSGGTIEHCYVRFTRYNENLDKASFGMLKGNGSGTLSDCYTPELSTYSRPDVNSETHLINVNSSVPNEGAMNPYTLTLTPTFFNMFVNDNMTGGSWTTGSSNLYNNGTPLLTKLNNKGNNTTWAGWKRTSAGNYDEAHGSGNINEDYPVLQLPGYTCLASTDGITIDYAHNLSDMLHRHNNGALNEKTTLTGNKYKPTNHPAINGGTINLFANDDVTLPSTGSKEGGETVADNCTAEGVVVYIDENTSLLQDASSNIEAYTGQTMKSYVKSQSKERWHYISSSLKDSKFGWTYGVQGDAGHTWAEDPCVFTLAQNNEDQALFPIDLISHKRVDFYCFYEPQYHWINFKRNSASHYHMDNWDANNHISYDNETQFTKGKGYLMSIEADYWYAYGKDAQFLQNRGTLNNGTVTIPVSYTADNEWTKLAGCNLLGNPYQSYLDFDVFATTNSGLWSDGDKYGKTYAIYDPKTDNYIQYVGGASEGALVADRFINMHQGFLIKVSNSGNATFNNNMRTNDPGENYPGFRGEQPAYPLINFILTDGEDNTDIAVLELNRPENDGAKKLRVGNPAGRIYFRYDNENLAIYFRNSDKDYQSLNFAAEEDGNFTLSWNTANADFRTLTLVDNITGIKTDMLTHDHYTFEGRVDDYNTRFKIVFGEMDNNEEEPVLEHFAFFDHGNLIVNGTGHFEVVDVLGRVVYATELTDTQNTVSLPSNVRGVCMLCFTRNNETKVQKMVIQ